MATMESPVRPAVLIVIPAYREARRLPVLLADVAAHAAAFARLDAPYTIHFRVVDGGSPQPESDAMRRSVEALRLDSLVSYDRLARNRGKGGAIRSGFDRGLAEGYRYLGFVDADAAVSIGELRRAVDCLVDTRNRPPLAGVIGSRVKLLGRRVERSAARHCVGRLFATIVSLMFGQSVYDTQCGLKVFEREALARHLDAPIDEHWTWDTALLFSMLHDGEPVHEIPIDWTERAGSKLTFVRDPVVMLWRLMRFRRRLGARDTSRRRTSG